MGTALYKYRISAPQTYYHIYNRGNQRRDIFLESADYSFYLARLQQDSTRHDFSIICYCLMPNHIHVVVRQNKETSTAKLMASLHTSYSMMFNKKYEKVGHLFQERYEENVIRDDEYMKCLVAYIHLNPVRAGVCRYPKEYRWSSYLEYANPANSGICDKNLIEGYGFSGNTFEEYVRLASVIDPKGAFDQLEDSPLHVSRGLSSRKIA